MRLAVRLKVIGSYNNLQVTVKLDEKVSTTFTKAMQTTYEGG